MKRQTCIVAALLCVAAIIALVRVAASSNSLARPWATLTVTNTNDGGAGSLRQAIANAVAGDTIEFNLSGCPCVIALTSAPLTINKNLFINGPGANLLTISGGNARRVFTIGALNIPSVTISGVTIANGNAGANPGGGINADRAFLTVSDSVVTNNTTAVNADNSGGGGIFIADGSLNVINSTVSGNSATANAGGGISAFSTNTVSSAVAMSLINSTVSGNSALRGGGVNVNPGASLTMSVSNIANNTARGGGGIFNSGALTIAGGNINGNTATGTGLNDGAGIFNSGTATLNGAVVFDNTAADNGGGIDSTGTVTLNGAIVDANTANAGNGGGIRSTGALNITLSNINRNNAVSGGGIFASGTLNLNTTTIGTNNTLAGGAGGAGINTTATANINQCNISGNIAASGDGGGIFNGGPLTLTNATLSGNQATAGGGEGGGLYNSVGITANLLHCTITGNSAVQRGGGVTNFGTANLRNTLIAQNTLPNSSPDAFGAFVSQGHNLLGINNNVTGLANGANNDLVGTSGAPVNAQLAPLAFNGGPTQTHALLPNSPALDRGNLAAGVTTDQRGRARPFDDPALANPFGANGSDIGAYEYEGVIWTGNSSSDWHTAGNWSNNAVPTGNETIVIPEIVGNDPVISASDVTLSSLILSAGRTLTINGNRTLTINDTLVMGGGNIDATGGTLTIGANGTIIRRSGYILGNLRKVFGGAASFVFPVGTTNGYSPVTVFDVVGTGNFTVRANQGAMPGISNPSVSLNRYWTLTNGGLASARLTFNYLQPDVQGTEANYRIFKDTNAAGAPFTFPDGNADNVDDANDTATTINPVTTFSNWSLGEPNAPTLAIVDKYKAYGYPDGNLLRWQSSYEALNLGFRVLREEGLRSVPITPSLIAGSALIAGPGAVLTAGNSYSWWDPEGRPDSVYWLEDVDADGKRTLHGPLKPAPAKAGSETQQKLRSALLDQLRPANCGAQNSFCGVVEKSGPSEIHNPQSAIRNPQSENPQSAIQTLQSGRAAIKMQVRQAGWYRVSGAQLAAAGLDVNTDARRLQLYVNGVQVPLETRAANGNRLGLNGLVEFYGVGQDTRETDTRTYWLVAGDGPGLRFGPSEISQPESGAAIPASGTPNAQAPNDNSFPYTIERKERTLYFAALNNGEENENFFGAIINNAPVSQTLNVTKLEGSAPATLQVTVQGATPATHRIRVSLNGFALGETRFTGKIRHTGRFNLGAGSLREGPNQLTLQALGGDADVSVTDVVSITYSHRYEAESNSLHFTTGTRRKVTVEGFTSSQVRVFDVTNPQRAFEVTARARPDAGGYAVTISGPNNGRTLYAVADAQALAPVSIVANEPSNWTNANNAADFLILTHPRFRQAAEALAARRRGDGLNTAIINVTDIYDEWNGGEKSGAAMSNFLRWARERWQTPPRYALLLGDASLDPRNYLGYGETDLVPTRYAATTYLETASDETVTDFDGDGVGEIMVGRLPARTAEQAQIMVNKILNYELQISAGALLIADRPDGYNFTGVSEDTRQALPETMPATLINRAGRTDAETRQAILAGLNAGPAFVQFAGHGSVEVWTGAPLLNAADAARLNNGPRLPVVSAMTCLNGYFQDVATESLAEALLKAPNGGAVAVWASTGLTPPASQAQMGRELARLLFNGGNMRLGDAVRQAKTSASDGEVRRTWVLFGDPTLPVR